MTLKSQSWAYFYPKGYLPPSVLCTLFTIGKTWKQHKCPSTEEWIKVWYIYTMNSAIKRVK